MIILGIDPGSRVTGYGIIQEKHQHLIYLDSGCIRTSVSNLGQKLLEIFNGITQLMQMHTPHEIAVEQVFMHQNPNSALKLGHARGAAMVAVAQYQSKIYEYSARTIKQAVVGSGSADKNQVKHMVITLLKLNRDPQNDAADALAVAICHSHSRKINLLNARL